MLEENDDRYVHGRERGRCEVKCPQKNGTRERFARNLILRNGTNSDAAPFGVPDKLVLRRVFGRNDAPIGCFSL